MSDVLSYNPQLLLEGPPLLGLRKVVQSRNKGAISLVFETEITVGTILMIPPVLEKLMLKLLLKDPRNFKVIARHRHGIFNFTVEV